MAQTKNTLLADELRPLILRRNWSFIFMVPDTISDGFTKQPFEGDTVDQEWAINSSWYQRRELVGQDNTTSLITCNI
jgi:hypothetical protein